MVKRQQGVVVGYIAVTIIVGFFQLLKFVWAHTCETVPDALIYTYMTLNLLWPIANFVVFVMVTGDNERTAHAIGEMVGHLGSQSLD